LAVNKAGFTWREGRKKVGVFITVANLYPSVFTIGKTAIKKSRKIAQTTATQTPAEQMELINFFWRDAIIFGACLSAERVVKGIEPPVSFGNVASQTLCPDVTHTVPYRLTEELNKVVLAHAELGLLDERWEKSKGET
jgi:hypothetical protein